MLRGKPNYLNGYPTWQGLFFVSYDGLASYGLADEDNLDIYNNYRKNFKKVRDEIIRLASLNLLKIVVDFNNCIEQKLTVYFWTSEKARNKYDGKIKELSSSLASGAFSGDYDNYIEELCLYFDFLHKIKYYKYEKLFNTFIHMIDFKQQNESVEFRIQLKNKADWVNFEWQNYNERKEKSEEYNLFKSA